MDGVEKLATQTERARSTTDRKIETPDILNALRAFSDIVRYLNTRRTKAAKLDLVDEASVQDALYLMLRPWIPDLVPESPGEKVGNRFSIKDFHVPSSNVVIEAKYVRNREHGKAITKELNDDIENYRYHPHCDDLIFFIYDPDGFLPDAAAVERHIHSGRVYGDKVLRCHAVIKP